MYIVFDKDIKTDYEGYIKLLQIIFDANQSFEEDIVFDFRNVKFFEANLCAVLGAIIEIISINDKKVSFVNINDLVKNVMRKNLFLIEYGFPYLFDYYNTTIQYQKFNPGKPEDDKRFNKYIQEQLLGKPAFPSHSELLGIHITRNIFELYENALTHGKCNFIHTCGQYFPKQPNMPLNVTIVDRGINFKENVSKFLNRHIAGNEAIEWGLQKGTTTKTGNISGGLGLNIIFDFVKQNNGKIQIISADGYWEWKNGKVTSQIFPYSFNGTIANIRFNLNDKSHYILKGEQADLHNIF